MPTSEVGFQSEADVQPECQQTRARYSGNAAQSDFTNARFRENQFHDFGNNSADVDCGLLRAKTVLDEGPITTIRNHFYVAPFAYRYTLTNRVVRGDPRHLIFLLAEFSAAAGHRKTRQWRRKAVRC
jgi:hypothetical protein